MKQTNLLTLIITPAIIAGIMGFALLALSNHVNIYTHDVLESHNKYMLLPFISVVSLIFGYVPAFCYLSKLLYSITPVTEQGIEEVTAIASSQAPALYIGQVFTAPASNCVFRVKAIKAALQYDNSLQYSF